MLSAGSGQILSVAFLPASSANYLAATQTVIIDVTSGGKLVPNLAWSNPQDISSGAPLGSAQLNASVDIPGTFLYSPPAGTVLKPGDRQILSVTFQPTDGATYAAVSRTVRINVTAALNKAMVRIAYLMPSNRAAQNSGTANLPMSCSRAAASIARICASSVTPIAAASLTACT